jgi:hypothetical protein
LKKKEIALLNDLNKLTNMLQPSTLNSIEEETIKEKTEALIVAKADMKQFMLKINEFKSLCNWLHDTILDNLYPGTSSDREVMCLDLLQVVIDIFDATSKQSKDMVIPIEFYSNTLVKTLLNLTHSGWDKTRRLSADTLLKFPRPLIGYNTTNEVNNLLTYSCAIVCSARQKDSGKRNRNRKNIFYCSAINYYHINIEHYFSYLQNQDND